MPFDNHDMVYVAITRADDSVAFMQFIATAWDSKRPEDMYIREPSDENIAAEVAKASVTWAKNHPDWMPIKGWRVIEEVEYRALLDSGFRNAIRDSGGMLGVDMGVARDMQRAALRLLRAPILAELDVAYQRADERADVNAKSAIAKKKQKLRDITSAPAIEAAMSPAELKQAAMDAFAPFEGQSSQG